MLVGLPESFPHGTRSAYVRGCRCRPCKDSNNAYYHARQKRAKALAAAAPPSPRPPDPQPQTWTAPDGTKQIRTYRRACAGWVGPAGDGCPWKSHLRKDSTGDLCRRCRERLVWNGLVPTATIVGRIRFASTEWGIGYKTYADAAGVAPSTVAKLLSGERKAIRRVTADRLMAVTKEAAADHAIVDGAETWAHIRWMLKRGLTRTELAARLGSEALTPALQLKKRVLAVTADKVAQLRRELEEERQIAREVDKLCVDCGYSHAPKHRRATIAKMLDASPADIIEAWPCFYGGESGQALLARDMKIVRDERKARAA